MLVLIVTVISCIFFTAPLVTFQQEDYGRYLGDECTLETTEEKAVCKHLDECEYAINLLKSNQIPQHCGYGAYSPIVCCPFANKSKSYRECVRNYANTRPGPRRYKGNIYYAVIGGARSFAEEFPHMALLGYGDINNIKWLCGGTLISEKFVLTAAHCLYHGELGTVKLVRLGELDLNSTTDIADPIDFSIVKIHQHPQFDANFYYNDIALLELNKTIKYTSFMKPACLYPNATFPNFPPIVTGWGRTSFLGDQSDYLLKAELKFINYTDCANIYSTADKKLPNGIMDYIQLCAGGIEGRDACPGDSGGPLQIRYFDPEQLITYYSVVGVTSFGKGCGFKSTAGVYTRVAPYVPWIEEIVWKHLDLY